jgi:hypothetical protein
MHTPARCRDRELTGSVDDPQPDGHAGKMAIGSKFLGSLSASQFGRLAVTGDRKRGCAPDLDFRYHAGRLSGEPLSTTVNYLTLTPPDSAVTAKLELGARE